MDHFFLILSLLVFSYACDPEGRKNCDWVLEPEPKNIGKVEEGFIPVCARNRKTMKQDCRLQTTLEKAKNFYGKKFRYVDLEVKSVVIPRTITKISFCDR